MTFVGFLTFLDPPKPGIARTLRELAALGISLRMVTGDNRLVAAHTARVVDEPGLASLETYSYLTTDLEPERAEAQRYLERQATTLRAAGRPVRVESRNRYAAAAIDAIARDNEIDLIAMTTHGGGGLARLALGKRGPGVLPGGQRAASFWSPRGPGSPKSARALKENWK